jgi:hypothetical protein
LIGSKKRLDPRRHAFAGYSGKTPGKGARLPTYRFMRLNRPTLFGLGLGYCTLALVVHARVSARHEA